MKLTMERSEGTTGLILKKPEYYLQVIFELNPEEIKLIKKHKWGDSPMCEYIGRTWGVSTFLLNTDKSKTGFGTRLTFSHVTALQKCENEIIENAKKLKESLEAVVGFTSGGAREIDL